MNCILNIGTGKKLDRIKIGSWTIAMN